MAKKSSKPSGNSRRRTALDKPPKAAKAAGRGRSGRSAAKSTRTSASKGAPTAATPTGRRKNAGPQQAQLPGTEQVRDGRLDAICESIGATRDQMAECNRDEQGDKQAALKRMRERGIMTHRHAGVELARVPGEEVLRVRRTKAGASAENLPEGDTETGDGGDAPLPQPEFEGDLGDGSQASSEVH